MNRSEVVFAVALFLAGASPLLAWQDAGKGAASPRTPAEAAQVRQWEIIFADGISTEEYARQLDYFRIDIGAVSKDGHIEYISKVSQYKPQKSLGVTSAEYRLQIPWKSGALQAADRRLLRKAGISSQGKQLQHFFPQPLRRKLEKLEADYAGRSRDEIRRTRFRIQPLPEGDGYRFVVVEQDPPKPGETPSTVSESLAPSPE
jgi:hypothetical protein